MRTLSFLLLVCVFPLIAQSQAELEKAIIDDHALPAFAEMFRKNNRTIVFSTTADTYIGASHIKTFLHETGPGFTVLRRLSPDHAIIRISDPNLNTSIFRYLLPSNDAWKTSPALLHAMNANKSVFRLLIHVRDTDIFKNSFREIRLIRELNGGIMLVQVSSREVIRRLLSSPIVLFADLADRQPHEELIVSGFDLGTNKVNAVHQLFPSITGEGLMLSLKENRFDTADIDLKGRVVYSSLASPTGSGHANIMATMAAGAGNSFYQGKGVAWKTSLQSANFASLIPETDAFYFAQRISVQNHSYGTGIENFYGADAAAYDLSVINNPNLVHVFSAGNSGQSAGTGPYSGINGFGNITGSFKMAKNVLVVGAIDSTGNIEAPSSRGPAYDGRIKPELVAFGLEGSSGSAAIVSGIALLVQDAYRVMHHDSLPTAALLKAVLINSADDVGIRGPDFASGFGNANGLESIRTITASKFLTGSVQQGSTQNFQLELPGGILNFKCTIAWTDPAAQANTLKALVNDIDIELVHTATGQTWKPWVLSRVANKDSLQLPAVRGQDTINNVEQITVEAPPAGMYFVKVNGRTITASQTFAIAYKIDTADRFEWLFPQANDPVTAGTSQLLRWNSSFTNGATGQLQYSYNDGISWQNAGGGIDLTRNYARWLVPDTFSTALLRMIINGSTYRSDTFAISKPVSTQVGFNCPDSFLFYWNRPFGVSRFRVYNLGAKFLEAVTVTSDSFYFNSINAVTSRQFTVAPVLKNREGMKSYTFDYSTQGVGCYFKNFFAQLENLQATLQLELGSTHRLSRILVQRAAGNAFNTIHTIDNPTALSYGFADAAPVQGINRYRVVLQLSDGQLIIGNTELVYFLGSLDYLLYPNPANLAAGFRILQKDAFEIRVIIHDITGRKVKDEVYSGLVNQVMTFNLQKGIYVVSIVKAGKREFTGKIVLK